MATDRYDSIEDFEPDELELADAAAEPQNDLGNSRRLLRYFGRDLLKVREVGPHYWNGTHWERNGARENLERMAHRTADLIEREVDLVEYSPSQARLLEHREAAAKDCRRRLIELADSDIDDGDKRKEIERRHDDLEVGIKKIRKTLQETKVSRSRFATSSGNRPRLTAMIECALAQATVSPERMDADPLKINLENGTLNVFEETYEIEEEPGDAFEPPEDIPPELIELPKSARKRWRIHHMPHDRADYISKVMPVRYDPNAECPAWLLFLERFQPDPEIRRYLQQYFGLALTGMTEQLFLFFYGSGANGKSTFMEAIARIMGPYAAVLPAEALTGNAQRKGGDATPDLARLPGARMVRCAELPRGQGFRENTLKLLTSGEPVLARNLNYSFFEFRPIFKVVGSGNDKPKISGVDEGIWRRFRLFFGRSRYRNRSACLSSKSSRSSGASVPGY